ncbi:MAG: aldehyde ferredoxin oxidoreductase [Deltaproteobacteria bacterium]|nr:aldehyde ferredoxin oxidoreductase [Deltaproteobacteria bacterium]MBW2085437.1 aldehyde ferredoxin oxidoreductase [Deltaproteobacteria bacterium]
MKILRVNMSNLETSLEDLPQEWQILGGRALSAQILKKEVSPAADPLGPEARLVIAAGPLAGTLAPSCGRISVGARSPLTLGIKEANAGGPTAQKLDRLGIRAIVVQGAAQDGKPHLLKIDKDGTVLEPADDYQGMKTYELAEALLKKYDNKAAVISIGPVGEKKYKSATVAFTDKDGHCSRHAGRGGLGGVMGAKGLKAIVVDDSGAPSIDLADKEAFREAVRGWTDIIKSDPMIQNMSKYGTPGVIVPLRSMGSMPSKNYSSEPTEGFENLSGQSIEKINQERGGSMDGCMPGCIVRCSVVYNDAQGKHLTSALEYETLALMGTNLGINDPDALARFDRFCDEMGIDTIELGSAMGVAASAGKMAMGDVDSAMALLEEVEKGTEFGATLANGVVSTSKALGVTRVPAFKGQAMPAHDARVTKATGVTYHTSPMGADHTAGLSYDDPMNKEGQVEKSLITQIANAAMDAFGYCNLAAPGDTKALFEFLKNLINARYGLSIGAEDIVNIGRATLKAELEFNEGAEFSKIHEPYPEFVRNEPLAPTGSVFDVDLDEIAKIWEKLDSIAVI